MQIKPVDFTRSSLSPDIWCFEGGSGSWAGSTAQWLAWSEGLWAELAAAFCGVQCLLSDRPSHRDHGAHHYYKRRLFFVPQTKCLFADLRICWKCWAWSFCRKIGKFSKCPWAISFKTGKRNCCIALCQTTSIRFLVWESLFLYSVCTSTRQWPVCRCLV